MTIKSELNDVFPLDRIVTEETHTLKTYEVQSGRTKLDSTSVDTTISTTSTESVEVDTSGADTIAVFIDDGTTGGVPPEYTMTERVYTSEDGWLFYDEVIEQTGRAWVDQAWGQKMEFEFDNTSGSDGTYRITVESYEQVD